MSRYKKILIQTFIQYYILFFTLSLGAAAPHFVIISPTYNSAPWCEQSLRSVRTQTYNNWHMVVINDCSTDNTASKIAAYIAKHSLQNRITLVNNSERKGPLFNWYHTIHACNDTDIIVMLDGDDWLSGPHVLERLAQEYSNEEIWLTYGQYRNHPDRSLGHCHKIPRKVRKKASYRKYPWCTSHLRTCRAWLFKKIAKNDLAYKNNFYAAAVDLAMMFPMLEMASPNHFSFIPDVLYIYNRSNPLSSNPARRALQKNLESIIRNHEKYIPLCPE